MFPFFKDVCLLAGSTALDTDGGILVGSKTIDDERIVGGRDVFTRDLQCDQRSAECQGRSKAYDSRRVLGIAAGKGRWSQDETLGPFYFLARSAGNTVCQEGLEE